MRSPYPDVTIPDVDLWTYMFERKELPYSPDKVLFHDTNSTRKYPYGHLRTTALTFGQSLCTEWKWQKKDVLAIFSPNDIDFPAVVLGCLWAAGTVTTANPAYTAAELTTQLQDSGAKALVTHPACLKTALEAAKRSGIPQNRIILLGGSGGNQELKHFTAIRSFSFLGRGNIARPCTIDPKNDIAFLVYSSGTTGKPKGVMLSHRNLVVNCLQVDTAWGQFLSSGTQTGEGARSILFLPMYHIYGLMVLTWSAFKGYETFTMPNFDLLKFCEIVEKEKITHNFVVPKVILGLAKHSIVAKFDLKSLRMLISGAAPLTQDLANMCYARLKIPIAQAYGMSETSPATHVVPWEQWENGIASVGRPISNTEAKIVSLDGGDAELGSNQEGELWIRGPQVFKGYHHNPTATANCLTPEGWYKTGDVAYVNEKGFFYITDRVKELIKYNGFQVAPAELEGLLLAHPQVEAAAVIGLFYEEIATEVPRAYVVVKKGVEKTRETAEGIAGWLKDRTAHHKWLRGGVKFVDEIPMNPSGKILRKELKAFAEREGRGRVWKL
ncbi:uncharacterized protein MYCFIDRAFT_43581 [Pseudocercospora fijiensis CIRAD86]|uniref:Acetyl-CoA synthetase-like protein n=1 Tax=Pseudocercospora fijiensis (strain CIRAD86) TaxID=383855 RepID=M2YM42_PSEFD|nr:uncharacterized protein MYCFIDRAFT_43581 [Pseudocercospora fijiensis CIRAD86]EME78790.1 hypothetical protein MYCFIDRAFT_43581 [Pseudocercospora fijiensis CIRAD86]